MRSATMLDRPASRAPRQGAADLLVLWQHPDSREFVPIGRFSASDDGFSFFYTRAAGKVRGFRPLPGLGNLRQRYQSEEIPAVFSQRVMSPDRMDYRDYLNTFGLSELATPWEQIVGSGGGRLGDTLQFMQVPTVANGRTNARFLINGVRHIPEAALHLPGRRVHVKPEQQESALGTLRQGFPLLLESEQDNPEDPNAILVTADGVPVGWVPRVLSSALRQLADSGTCHAQVHRIGDSSTPDHLRLVVDLDVPVPGQFTFDPDGLWEPLADQ